MKTIRVNSKKVLGLAESVGDVCLSGAIGAATAKIIQESFKLPEIIAVAISASTSLATGTIIGYVLRKTGVFDGINEPLITIDETDDLVG